MLGSISAVAAENAPFAIRDAQLEPVKWEEIAGWADDDHAAALKTFQKSCAAIRRRGTAVRAAAQPAALFSRVCARAVSAGTASARQFFERNFQAVRIARLGESEGFLTGYYEPIVAGSRTRSDEYSVPMYRRPPDLITEAPPSNGVPANKGKVWRTENGSLVPYYDRAEIDAGALAGKDLEICWLKDPIDAFFIHIQGSARVRLEDGGTLRLNYDGYNGHSYTPVGGVLVRRGQVSREEMSMDRIREWMRANPSEAQALRHENRSFVFFRVAELAAHEEAIGGQGIPLTAERSIAIDRALHAYGTPFWIDAQLPLKEAGSSDSFRRLMIAQDTGSAIIGPARADIYFGAGDEAGAIAGRIKHPARFIMLIPGTVSLAGGRTPFPRPKPAS